jgi:hypothetical protein
LVDDADACGFAPLRKSEFEKVELAFVRFEIAAEVFGDADLLEAVKSVVEKCGDA